MFEDLKGKRVLVTGASSGIGANIAELLGSYGASVGVHYRSNKKGALEVIDKITKKGGKAKLFMGDLLQISAAIKLLESFVNTSGGIDVLVNNAGEIYGEVNFLELDEKSWDDTFTLNAKAPFFLAREAFRIMKEQGGGKIINISSVSAKYGGSLKTMHYGAAKSALDSITIGLARAGAEYNILVNSVRGGFINTPLHKKLGRSEKDIKDRIRKIPLKRAGEPEDIARMILFLASKAGDYITGEIFTVAGGD
ncbi:MAG: SDR family oxidoreductase [Dehalococcoidales bacterium]|nr:SDR family oxidoreductase [Dehalococcoidales bacterium]